ncbi:MAG TPA: thioredoxin domain-containing protein [Burkholderiales bacterium]|nr:thioredoxin domain-containing protein [Burkholderiales bacterium]
MIACTLQDKARGPKFIAMISGMSLAAFSRILLAGLSLAAGAALAQSGERGAADAALVERIREAVIRELRESGALERAVDEGVERYVERQRAAAAQREQREAETRTAAVRPVSKARDHILGNPEAPVTLIEYSDFECPFCKRFHVTVKKLVEESGGQVRWVYRQFPLEELHPVKARRESVASECAAELGGNEAFWKFADRFYELTPSNNRTDVDAVLPRIAREIGLDEAKFASCVASGRHDRRVQEDYENATATGGRGTPWSIVVSKRGKTYPLSGAQPYAAARELVERARRER